ncbi:DUF3618 domain-containing protein [Streptomyces marincola]|uniref:DUF3618 domain-containing protein n=1 Tax=Streptomyces marincola TaxID=2878388 RepID=UPI001CF3A7A3|nr:DUF3618 domain-containing protein [Streptomyces marincola]UCM91385.1 DUF3618 domain-containing protein [Streptomyces marincola]
MGASPDRIRADIEATRTKLADDLDRLADRASPRRMAHRRTERVRGAASGLRERVSGTAAHGAEEAGGRGRNAARGTRDAASHAGESLGRAPGRAASGTRGNPLAAGAIAFGAGLMAASLAPASRPEQQAAARISERSGPVRDAATASARHLKDDGTEAARRAADNVKESATRAFRER